MMLRNYETMFVLTPVLTNEQIEITVQKLRNLLVAKGAQIVHEEAIGLKKLAYPIQHKNTGIYQLIEFQSMPHVIIDLETAYKRDESIIRFLTCVLDKDGIEYNKTKREGIHYINSSNDKASREDVELAFELNQKEIE